MTPRSPTSGIPATKPQEPTHLTGYPIDEHEMVRRGVVELPNEEADPTVIGQAALAPESLARMRQTHKPSPHARPQRS